MTNRDVGPHLHIHAASVRFPLDTDNFQEWKRHVDAAREDGRQSALAGESLFDCPYQPDPRHPGLISGPWALIDAWREGFIEQSTAVKRSFKWRFMEDNELLELAAKAAEYEFKLGGFDLHGKQVYMAKPHDEHFFRAPWNPLTDDGDALRLAARLRFDVRIGSMDTEVSPYASNGWSHKGTVESHNGDTCAATRRAIVLAAASLASHPNAILNKLDDDGLTH